MRSKAHIKGHPLHPILVSFPIAFLTGTFLTDIIYLVTGKILFFQLATYLEAGGILFAIVAAVPGIIDYYAVVPPESSAKKRATNHGILNFGMLFIFITALLIRQNSEIGIYVILSLETVGVIILTAAGWLGGTLVHRNQIGVDHRYANAGKWREEKINSEGKIELTGLASLGVNQMKLIHVNNKRIVIGSTDTEFVAFDDRCTHRGASLADGVMICGTVQCPWHGSQFNVKTGTVEAGPAKDPIKCYVIEQVEQKYFLKL
jgi:uncharacterized membrane protein/nitrite reductase/ring-hydroxylating ferredoxin subunit